ncbi:MAG: RHS repeat-associated core domain-containing protein [Flavipsychrobacter sp.]
MPPKAIAANPTSTNFLSSIKPYCFYVVRNQYGNIVQKYAPGTNRPEYVIYDTRHRPVMFQSAKLYNQHKWEYTIYDSRDHIILMGVVTDTNSYSTWQGWADGSKALPAVTYDPVTGFPIITLHPFIYNGFQGTYPSYIANGNIRVINYYDNYSYDTLFSNRVFDSSSASSYITDMYALHPTPFYFTQGMLTASKTSVDSGTNFPNQWISSVYFYDQKGSVIQTQTLNPWNTATWDIATTQYNFSGQPILTINKHNSWTGCNKRQTTIFTNYTYDNFDGKLTGIEQRTDTTGWVDISDFVYDNLRKESHKSIGGIEYQDFSYNIRGQLQGINADYAASPYGISNKTFGCILNYDYGFAQKRYDGNPAGLQWRSAGNPSLLRAYGYSYDPAGRLIQADYRQQVTSYPLVSGAPWTNNTVDYTMSNVTYDLNGNILTMSHMGTPPGASAPVPIDVLKYTYDSGNSLLSVSDSVKINYNLGDFQDVTPCKTCGDYHYDENGNLISDTNKKVSSITYNELNEPIKVTFPYGSINNVYDGRGNLLQKIINNDTLGTKDTLRYWGLFNYKNDSLQYILHSEGRARWQADSSKFKYDFFVRDHLGNVRTVVTSDVSPDPVNYFASHEVASAKLEYSVFANIANVADNNPDPPGPYNQMAARLNGSDPDRRIGTALLLQVMAGDKFDVSANSYWDDTAYTSATTDPNSMLNAIVGTLVTGAGGFNNGENGSSVVNSLFSSSNYLGVYTGIVDSLSDTTIPQAFINYVVYDNNMNIVGAQSGAVQVNATSGSWQPFGTPEPITINQNGYVAIYMSNISLGNVYMDNLSVNHYQGRLMQEQHYYPFGLAISGGSSFNALPNKFLCQSNEVHNELGLNQSDFNFRQYDYQIGRFTSIDPLAASRPSFSPYHAFGDNPASVVDPFGLDDEGGDNNGSDGSADGDATASTMGYYYYFTGAGDGTVNFSNGPDNASFTFFAPLALDYGSYTSYFNSLSSDVASTQDIGFLSPANSPALSNVVSPIDVGPVKVPDISPTLQAQGAFVQSESGLLLGMGDAVTDAAKGMYNLVAHPVNTFNNIKSDVYNKFITGYYALPYGHAEATEFDHATSFGQSYMVGRMIGGLLPMFAGPEAEVGEVTEIGTVSEEQGGLNLFKFKSPQAETPNNWKTGDRFLKMYDQGTPKLNWKQNSGFLRTEMNKGNPIFDSYLDANGNLQSTRGFLNAERYLLLDRGWQFDPNFGAWMPPH